MEREQIRRFLNYYDAALVDHAVRRANLSAHELQAVQLREFDGETVESAAERLDLSPGTIKNRYRAGMSVDPYAAQRGHARVGGKGGDEDMEKLFRKFMEQYSDR